MLQRESACADDARLLARDRLHDREVLGREWRTAGVNALRFVRDEMRLTNVQIMVPFVRTVGEAHAVGQLLAENGLRRGENDLKVIMMCELPSNAVLADEFLRYFDGFSIGSNDMT